MKRTYRTLLMVLGGSVGGYLGYWIGHWAGWSTDADWPWRIGGGVGAILTSIALAVVGVVAVGAVFGLPPVMVARRLRRDGIELPGVIEERHFLGLHATGLHSLYDEFEFRVRVTLPDGGVRTLRSAQWLSPDQRDRFVPGALVTVRHDPAHPTRVLIDSLREPISA